MKRNLLLLLCAFVIISCGTSKKTATSVYSDTEKAKSLEGNTVMTQAIAMEGVEMVQTLNDDGTDIISRPFKWFAGIGKADDKRFAIEMAQRDAYATISRTLNNFVSEQADMGALYNDGAVHEALTSYWKQVSVSVQNACEPFGEVMVEYDPSTGMYTVTAKVGVRGDRYNALINKAGNYEPSDLNGEQLEEFTRINEAIRNAARGN